MVEAFSGNGGSGKRVRSYCSIRVLSRAIVTRFPPCSNATMVTFTWIRIKRVVDGEDLDVCYYYYGEDGNLEEIKAKRSGESSALNDPRLLKRQGSRWENLWLIWTNLPQIKVKDSGEWINPSMSAVISKTNTHLKQKRSTYHIWPSASPTAPRMVKKLMNTETRWRNVR